MIATLSIILLIFLLFTILKWSFKFLICLIIIALGTLAFYIFDPVGKITHGTQMMKAQIHSTEKK